jgi:hypothetical protein
VSVKPRSLLSCLPKVNFFGVQEAKHEHMRHKHRACTHNACLEPLQTYTHTSTEHLERTRASERASERERKRSARASERERLFREMLHRILGQ